MNGVAGTTVDRVHAQVAALGHGRGLLAVSGGVDSMVLLDAATATLPASCITVATFDHATGPAAQAAASFVAEAATSAGLDCITGRASPQAGMGNEAEWRRLRWRFLSDEASRRGARVITGHTQDDQIETIFMRILRGAGARGLAGLEAGSPVLRPLLRVSRAEIMAYAAERDITFVTDPSNSDRRHLRNRVRLDLLPAIEAMHSGFGPALLDIGQHAADWRARMEAVALTFPMMTDNSGMHSFARASLRDHSLDSLKVLWPALAARAGVVMDRRGTERLSEFTIEGETGQAIQLAGDTEVTMSRDTINFHPRSDSRSSRA